MISIQLSIIKAKGRISILEKQLQKMEFALSLNREKELDNAERKKHSFIDFFRFIFQYEYSQYSIAALKKKIEFKKEQLINYRILLETLQELLIQKKERSKLKRQKNKKRISDIILTLGIEKIFDYGLSLSQKSDNNNQVVVYQQINGNGNNYFIQQNSSKEYNILIQGIPLFLTAILIYFLRC